MKRFLSTCFGIAAIVSLNAQCSVIEVPLQQRANASTVIVEGKVISQVSYWNTTHEMIYTSNTIELYKIFKGNVSGSTVEIITEGGTVGLDKITVEPTLNLEVGQVGMFTCVPVTRAKNLPLSRGGAPRFQAYASVQGFVKYDEETATASDPFRTYNNVQQEVYDVCAPAGHHQYIEVQPYDLSHANQRSGDPQSPQAGPSISNLSPTTLTAGTGSVLTITGSNFGTVQASSVVRFKNADDGGATTVSPLASQYLSWSSTQITVEVPANAGTGVVQVFINPSTATSSQTLTISYAHLNVDFDPGSGTIAYQTDHVDDNGSGGYTWRMNTAFDADAPARASFMRAFDSWRCATGVNWTIGANTSINDAVSDGTNIICYDNTAPLDPGILGVCYSYWSGCASGPTIVWYVNELDIIFDEGSNISPLTWEFGPATPSGSEYDFETVAVHELGHGHQLGHVISPGAIMHYAISNGTSNRSLGANDLAGGQFVQGKSIINNVCGPGAMSNYVCGTPPVASFSGTPTTVCAGGSVSFTDLSSGTPTSWIWTCPGGTPSSSNAQNPTITYNTPGTYNVSLTASNAAGSNSVTMTGYITVNAAPSVGFSASPGTTVCAGTQVTLSGTGAQSYAWTGGVTDGVAFTPPSTTSYTVTGTDVNGCTGQATASITVNSAPSLSIVSSPSNAIVCTGNQATLTASGAASYVWTGGITNGVAFTPPATTTYTVTGTSAAGCTSTAQKTITVQSCSGTTQLNATWCGATNCNLAQTIVANTVSGATNYEFWFENTSLGYSQTRQKGNGIASIGISWIAGVQYGVTYQVRVRAYVGGVWGAYGPACSLSMAAQQPATQLTNCAMTNLTYSSLLVVNAVSGAQDYQYEITNAQQPLSTTRLRGSPTNSIAISWLTGIQYGRTYNVRVRSKVGGVWGSYGPTCTFTMQAANPPTQLTSPSCGGTGMTHTSTLAWSAVTGATNYRVNIANASLGYSQTKTKGNSGTTMVLSTFSGLLANQTYTVTVSSYIGGAWGAFGPACTITMGSVVRIANPEMDENGNADFNFGISMYPNPIGDGVNPTINITGADQRDAVVTVMDLTGRVVTTYQLFVDSDDYSTELTNFPDLVAGMYIMQVQIGDKVQSQKFIAQ